MTLTQLTNQELITELQKRIQNKTLGAEVVATEVEQTSKSLLSRLDSKSLLFSIGLTVGFTLLIYYSIQVTSSSTTGVKIEFESNPPQTVSLPNDINLEEK